MISAQQLIRAPSFRWCASFLIVVTVSAVAVMVVLYGHSPNNTASASPPSAMMVELALMPVAPLLPSRTLPPAPRQEKTPPLPQLIPEPEIEPMVELPVVEKAEAILLPKPEPIEELRKPIEQIVEAHESASQVVKAPVVEVAGAPIEGVVSLVASQAKTTWQSVLLGHLERHKRYPRRARRRGQEATVHVWVAISREGAVLEHHLTEASQYSALNKETLALIARAQPLPPPPTEVSGDTVEFVLPVSFSLHY